MSNEMPIQTDPEVRDCIGEAVMTSMTCDHEFAEAVCPTCWESTQRIGEALVRSLPQLQSPNALPAPVQSLREEVLWSCPECKGQTTSSPALGHADGCGSRMVKRTRLVTKWSEGHALSAPVQAAESAEVGGYEIGFHFQDGEVMSIDDLRAGRGVFDDEVPTIVGRRTGDDEWIELGDEFRAEYDAQAAEEVGGDDD